MVTAEAEESGLNLYPRSQLGNDRLIREVGLKTGFTEGELLRLVTEGRECIPTMFNLREFARYKDETKVKQEAYNIVAGEKKKSTNGRASNRSRKGLNRQNFERRNQSGQSSNDNTVKLNAVEALEGDLLSAFEDYHPQDDNRSHMFDIIDSCLSKSV